MRLSEKKKGTPYEKSQKRRRDPHGSPASGSASFAESASTAFTYELKNLPSYTVTIPESVVITNEGSDVKHLDGQKVSITIAGTDAYRNQMLLSGKTESGSAASIRYKFVMADDTVVETTGQKDEVVGTELASFTEDGSVSFKAYPVLSNSSSIKHGVTYTGTMTYGIALTDANG